MMMMRLLLLLDDCSCIEVEYFIAGGHIRWRHLCFGPIATRVVVIFILYNHCVLAIAAPSSGMMGLLLLLLQLVGSLSFIMLLLMVVFVVVMG